MWLGGQRASLPTNQASSRRIYAKQVQITPIPIHRRDAPCVRPAVLSASCAITHPTCLSASCRLVGVLRDVPPNMHFTCSGHQGCDIHEIVSKYLLLLRPGDYAPPKNIAQRNIPYLTRPRRSFSAEKRICPHYLQGGHSCVEYRRFLSSGGAAGGELADSSRSSL